MMQIQSTPDCLQITLNQYKRRLFIAPLVETSLRRTPTRRDPKTTVYAYNKFGSHRFCASVSFVPASTLTGLYKTSIAVALLLILSLVCSAN